MLEGRFIGKRLSGNYLFLLTPVNIPLRNCIHFQIQKPHKDYFDNPPLSIFIFQFNSPIENPSTQENPPVSVLFNNDWITPRFNCSSPGNRNREQFSVLGRARRGDFIVHRPRGDTARSKYISPATLNNSIPRHSCTSSLSQPLPPTSIPMK